MMDDKGPKKAGNKWPIALFVLAMVAGGIVGAVVYRTRIAQKKDGIKGFSEGVGERKLTAEECRDVIALKDTAIGHLENGPGELEVEGRRVSGLELAAEGFERLAETLPGERLPLRDDAIARLLVLRNARENVEHQRDVARAAAERLIAFDKSSAVACWLGAQVGLHADPNNPEGVRADTRAAAVELLKRATELEPKNPIYWFALYRGATPPRESQPNQLAREALARAYSLQPRNFYLITEWLLAQAKVQDPAIVQTLTDSKEVFMRLAATIKTRRVDISQTIDAAIQGAKDGKWSVVTARVRLIQNVVRPEEIAKSDITRVDVHPLEFVLYDFSPEFYRDHRIATPSWSESVAVKLVSANAGPLAALKDLQDVVVADFDLSGLPDLVTLQSGKLSYYGHSKIDAPWQQRASLEVPAGMKGLLVADLDRDNRKSNSAPAAGDGKANGPGQKFDHVISEITPCHDADPDVVLYGKEGAVVIRNDTEKTGDAPKMTRVANDALTKLTDVTAGIMVDFDHDSDLDLVLSSAQGITLWEAGEKLQYRDVTHFSTLPPTDIPVTTMVAVDWDRDVDIDVVVGEPTGRVVGYLENLRHGQFRWTPLATPFEQLKRPAAVALVEADGNVSWDLLSAGQQGVQLSLTATPRAGIVNFVKLREFTKQPQKGVLAWDFDNDGYRDAASWGDDGLHVFRGAPQGRFVEASVVDGSVTGPILDAESADIDRDGDEDLVLVRTGGLQLLRNDGGNQQGWITLYPMGRYDNKGRCNHHAIGSMVELRAGGWYQAQVVHAPTIHFGLGDRPKAEQLRIVWTNGVPQDLIDVGRNVAICEKMVLKGSCPYVYTMADGKFTFLTDCLWAAPIGLQTPEGGVAPTRPWEYLRIGGERLTPKDGSYWIQLTEELWEAGYFDKVQLIAIDHPADVEVFSNEKVGPADIAQFKIHTVSQRRFPRTARDQDGRDWTAALRARDGQVVRAFGTRIRQGLTSEHFVELDLGPGENPRQITLFLTGWIMPTDTSLNVAFRQDPETDGPRMPSLWVPDKQGQWRQAIGYLGFPGGKTKTIAVDLSDAFLTDDYRLRIKTSAEIYWDEAFFTVDEPAVPLRQIPLELQSAELAYRGFSRPLMYRDDAPQMYDHGEVSRQPIWPPMRGHFTRYGPVRELLLAADDRLAVLGAGDALTVRFAVPDTDPPEGWKRDFFLHSIGYDKDADLNTIYGQTVEPLPFRAMQAYPFDPNEPKPDSPAYRDYLRRFQTRQQDPAAFWRQLVTGSGRVESGATGAGRNGVDATGPGA